MYQVVKMPSCELPAWLSSFTECWNLNYNLIVADIEEEENVSENTDSSFEVASTDNDDEDDDDDDLDNLYFELSDMSNF